MRKRSIKISQIRNRHDADGLCNSGIHSVDLIQPVIAVCDGGSCEVLDGMHRLCSVIKSGDKSIKAVVVTKKEMAKCREFGGGSMNEGDWIDWVQEKAR